MSTLQSDVTSSQPRTVESGAKPTSSTVPARPATPRLGLSRRLRLMASLGRNVFYDAHRFWTHSFLTGAREREQLRGRMHMTGHFLEYGMSLKDPRRGFGLDRVETLIADLETYCARYEADSTAEIMIRTLEAYIAFNDGADVDLAWLKARLAQLPAPAASGLRGGSEVVTREEIQRRGMMDFLDFAEARHSIRQYAPGPVAQEKIDRAVRVAQQTPSSCNRQTCRVYIWTEPALVRRVLALQSGNRGFGDQIAGVAVVASELTHWHEVEERYQGWVDAGMFAMSLAYGFHAEGLGAVMLNWGEEHRRDKELRALTGIPESSLVATMIGFGNLPESLQVPVSQREPLEQCLTMNLPLRG
ncbi:nitroreductase family protein [Consotaella aegiceratis]|uniref:nitroreductase family protein n=1 Tax=Consotaella aegiceratis TaxID=3097961 RepID=UPI002F3F602C